MKGNEVSAVHLHNKQALSNNQLIGIKQIGQRYDVRVVCPILFIMNRSQ